MARPEPLSVQRYLRDGNSVKDCCREFGLKERWHPEHPNLVCLHYIDYKAKFSHRIAQECRGLVLDSEDDWAVVAFPYTKFFNHKESYAAKIDKSTAVVFEKLDGSLATLYPYKGEWHVASSSLPDAGGLLSCGYRFSDLFWATWKEESYRLPPPPEDGGLRRCYMFEMLHPSNTIVCTVECPSLVLHGVRCLDTLRELDPVPVAEELGWKCTAPLELTYERCLDAVQELDGRRNEGYVIRDAAWNRIKVKAPSYVMLANITEKTRTGAGFRGPELVGIALKGEVDEVNAYFPQYAPLLGKIAECLAKSAWVYDTAVSMASRVKRGIRSVPAKERVRQGLPKDLDLKLVDALQTTKTKALDYFRRDISATWSLIKREHPSITSLYAEDAKNYLVPLDDSIPPAAKDEAREAVRSATAELKPPAASEGPQATHEEKESSAAAPSQRKSKGKTRTSRVGREKPASRADERKNELEELLESIPGEYSA